jgi:ABC-type spermidine/putrescine transport system permease subunit II
MPSFFNPVLTSTVGALLIGLWLAYLFATRGIGRIATMRLLLWFLALVPWVVLAAVRWSPGVTAAGVMGGGSLVAIITALDFRDLRERCDSARSLGASEWRIFWRVFLPMQRGCLVIALLAALVRLIIEHAIVIDL